MIAPIMAKITEVAINDEGLWFNRLQIIPDHSRTTLRGAKVNIRITAISTARLFIILVFSIKVRYLGIGLNPC